MRSRQTRLTLLGMALGILLALLIAPQTRWLVRLQAMISVGLYHLLPGESGSYTVSPEEDERCIRAVAARHPDDYPIQYAATRGRTNAEILIKLRALTVRFPDRAALEASILRYETMGNIHLVRSENSLLLGQKNDARTVFKLPTPQQLAVFDREAATGERMDPNNAYFPFMRAVGLFAAHQDAAGVEAIRRAGRKSVWQEYLSDDVESWWRLHQEAFGDAGALPRVAILSNTLLPQYQGLSQAARFAIYKAMRAEQTGHPQEGLELREAVRRCGDLMRVQSSPLIASIVGGAICTTSCLRPGGAPPAKNVDFQHDKGAIARYAAYARRLGREDIARKAEAEYAAGTQISALMQSDGTIGGDVMSNINLLDHWWVADLLTLGNVFWVLLLGTAVALLTRLGRSLSWSAALRQSFRIVPLLPLLMLLWVLALNWYDWLQGWPDWLAYGGGLLLLAGLALGVRQLIRHTDWRKFRGQGAWRILGMILLNSLGLYGLYAFVNWQAHGVWQASAAPFSFQSDPVSDTNQLIIQQMQWWSFGGVIAVPLLLIVVFIAARIRRVPVSVGLAHSFQAAVLPAFCLLMLVYGVLLMGTARQERVVNEQSQHVLHDEGRHLTALAGQAWPGPVR